MSVTFQGEKGDLGPVGPPGDVSGNDAINMNSSTIHFYPFSFHVVAET